MGGQFYGGAIMWVDREELPEEPRSERSIHSSFEYPDFVVAVVAAVAVVNFAEEGGRIKENSDAPVGV